MADTVKTKAPAKPRKTATKKETAPLAPLTMMPAHEEIQKLAQKYWAQRGYQDGYAEQDWLLAEQELRKMAS
jgi:hypothetical protein